MESSKNEVTSKISIRDNTEYHGEFHQDTSGQPVDFVSVHYSVPKCRPEFAGPSGKNCGGIEYEPGISSMGMWHGN